MLFPPCSSSFQALSLPISFSAALEPDEAVKRSSEDPAGDFHLFNFCLPDCIPTLDESQLTQTRSCAIPTALIHTTRCLNSSLPLLALLLRSLQTANEVNHNCFSLDPFTPTADGERLHPQYSFN